MSKETEKPSGNNKDVLDPGTQKARIIFFYLQTFIIFIQNVPEQ